MPRQMNPINRMRCAPLFVTARKFSLLMIGLSATTFISLTNTAHASSIPPRMPVYPLKVSGNGRYLVDQNNVPFFIAGDSPQALIARLSEAQAAAYFADRQALGFNAAWINLLCNSYTGGNPDGTTFDGIAPFIRPGDLSTPNAAYFNRVDDMINLAAQYGLTVILDPIETGGWLTTLENNGETAAFNYGVYVGSRYKSFPNIVWMHGNDFQNWRNAADDALVQAVAKGIRSVDHNHIHTAELSYPVSTSLDDSDWASTISLNAAYTYYPTYAEVLFGYSQSSAVPVFMVEANYEFENNTGMDYGSPAILRRQEYWTQLSGATGQLYGNHYTWQFVDHWQHNLDTTGAIEFGYMKEFFASRAWYNLAPDQDHTLVTAGYGTFAARGSLGSNDYVTAARTPDGSLVIAYLPTRRTITVDMSKLSGQATAAWFDPTNNTYVPTSGSALPNSSFKEFTPPRKNGAGDSDWLLVLEAATGGIAPTPASVGLVQLNAATPQTNQSTVSVIYYGSQQAANTNIVAIGWNDSTSNITSVRDSAGNRYEVAVPAARGSGLSQAIYYAKNIKAAAAGDNTVSVAFDTEVAYADVRILEYSGLDKKDPFDVGASRSGPSSVADSGPVIASFAKELIIGAGMTVGSFSSPGLGFNARVITTPDADIVEDKTTVTVGSYAATAPVSDAWLMQVVAFKASAQ